MNVLQSETQTELTLMSARSTDLRPRDATRLTSLLTSPDTERPRTPMNPSSARCQKSIRRPIQQRWIQGPMPVCTELVGTYAEISEISGAAACEHEVNLLSEFSAMFRPRFRT